MVPLPDAVTEADLVRAAQREGLLLDGLARCHAGPPTRYGVTPGFAAPRGWGETAAALPALVAILAGARE